MVLDGTLESLLTAVYKYYHNKLIPSRILDGSAAALQPSLGEELFYLTTDYEQAKTVFDAIEAKLSADTQRSIFKAIASCENDKLYDIFRYILLAFRDPYHVDEYERFDYVLHVHKLVRNVSSEIHLLKGFTRFKKAASGVLYADISPKHNTLPFVCEHFTDRLSNERWIIHDVQRGIAGFYDTEQCVVAPVPEGFTARFEEDAREQDFQNLWNIFYRTIGIQDRKNSKLRIQLSPKRFWKHMTEHKLRFYDE